MAIVPQLYWSKPTGQFPPSHPSKEECDPWEWSLPPRTYSGGAHTPCSPLASLSLPWGWVPLTSSPRLHCTASRAQPLYSHLWTRLGKSAPSENQSHGPPRQVGRAMPGPQRSVQGVMGAAGDACPGKGQRSKQGRAALEVRGPLCCLFGPLHA